MPSKFDVPVDNPAALIKWAEQLWHEGSQQRPDFVPRLSLAFYHGHHFLILDPRDRRVRKFRNDSRDPHAPVRISAPIIGDIIDRVIAKLTKHLPVPEARPVTDEPDDRDAAKVATKILAHEWDRLRMQTKMPELYSWVVPVGYAFLQITWDADDGTQIGRDKDGNSISSGEINVDIASSFELIYDSGAKTIEDARWCIRTSALTPREVYERYGIEVESEEIHRTLGDELLGLDNVFNDTAKPVHRVAVRQLWIRPKAMRSVPDGIVVTWAGQKVIALKPFPYKHGKLPFVQINYQSPQGSSYGRTPVPQLIPLQMDYNDAKSRMATIRRMLAPKLTAPEGSVDFDALTSRVEGVPYKEAFGGKPEWLMPDGRWMSQFTEAMDRAEREMKERMGLTEANTGQLPGTSAAATAIQQAELASEPQTIPQLELIKAIEAVGWNILQLVRQYWREKRVIRTWSKAGTLEIRRFSRADLTKQTDVKVTQESGLPRSKAGRAQLFIELWQQGIVTDPRMFIQMLDLPPTDILTDEFNRQVKKQERELGRMLDGGPVEQVDPLSDNHELHAKVLIDFMQEAEWEDVVRNTPDRAETIRDHLIGHISILGSQTQGETGAPPGGPNALSFNQGVGPAEVSGLPGQAPPPVPGLTDLALLGGRTGQPGLVPGVDEDTQAAALGL